MPRKPAKPRPDFPLWWRVDARCADGGYWCRTINGRQMGFGPDADRAEDLYEAHLQASAGGPLTTHATATVADVYALYVERQHARAEAGTIKPREFDDSRRALDHFAAAVGADRPARELGPRDFTDYHRTLAATFGRVQINKRIYTIRKAFAHAADADLIVHAPKFGPDFIPADVDALAKMKQRSDTRRGRRTLDRTPYTARQVRRLIRDASQPMRAMILLAINCAFGPTDCALLTLDKLHLQIERDAAGGIRRARGYHDFPRPKNQAVERRCPLWPITAHALHEWLPRRPAAREREHADRMFLTRRGGVWVRAVVHTDEAGNIGAINPDDAIGKEFDKLQKSLGIKRPGRRFKSLRRTHATAANDVLDRDARRLVMGHGFEGMDPHYVRGMFPVARLQAVTDHVGRVLLGCVELSCAARPVAAVCRAG